MRSHLSQVILHHPGKCGDRTKLQTLTLQYHTTSVRSMGMTIKICPTYWCNTCCMQLFSRELRLQKIWHNWTWHSWPNCFKVTFNRSDNKLNMLTLVDSKALCGRYREPLKRDTPPHGIREPCKRDALTKGQGQRVLCVRPYPRRGGPETKDLLPSLRRGWGWSLT